MESSQYLAFAGVIVYLSGFAIYNWNILSGRITPNKATWLLWAFIALLNGITYLCMNGDWVKSLGPLIAIMTNAGTFFLALRLGKLSHLSTSEKVLTIAGVIAILLWWATRDPTWSNMLLQVCILISITPTWKTVWDDPTTERPLPWFVLGVSYIFNLAVVVMRWRGWPDLAFPINCIAIHCVVGFLALRRTPKPAPR